MFTNMEEDKKLMAMRKYCIEFCKSFGLAVGGQHNLTSALLLQRWYDQSHDHTLYRIGSDGTMYRVAEISETSSAGYIHVAYGILKSVEGGEYR